MMHGQLGRALSRWIEVSGERRAALDALRGGVGFWLNRKVASAFVSIRDEATSKVSAQRIFSRMLNQSLARALRAWVELVTAQADALHVLARAATWPSNRTRRSSCCGPPCHA